jgi:4-amino-4-deoxy-L-arabinose transferase-like glycosyltransferase
MLSDYGPRPDGWVFDSALDVLSVGSVAVLIKMALHGVVRGRATFALMVGWCVCLVGIATFTKDPNTATETLRGAIHLYATAAACFCLPIASLFIGWQHRRDPEWRRWAWASQILALVSVPCFLPFVVSFFIIRMSHSPGLNAVPTGLVERLMGGLDIVILVVLALWAHRASSRPQLMPAQGV